MADPRDGDPRERLGSVDGDRHRDTVRDGRRSVDLEVCIYVCMYVLEHLCCMHACMKEKLENKRHNVSSGGTFDTRILSFCTRRGVSPGHVSNKEQ